MTIESSHINDKSVICMTHTQYNVHFDILRKTEIRNKFSLGVKSGLGSDLKEGDGSNPHLFVTLMPSHNHLTNLNAFLIKSWEGLVSSVHLEVQIWNNVVKERASYSKLNITSLKAGIMGSCGGLIPKSAFNAHTNTPQWTKKFENIGLGVGAG